MFESSPILDYFPDVDCKKRRSNDENCIQRTAVLAGYALDGKSAVLMHHVHDVSKRDAQAWSCCFCEADWSRTRNKILKIMMIVDRFNWTIWFYNIMRLLDVDGFAAGKKPLNPRWHSLLELPFGQLRTAEDLVYELTLSNCDYRSDGLEARKWQIKG